MIYSSSGSVHAGYVTRVSARRVNPLLQLFISIADEQRLLAGHGPAVIMALSSQLSIYRNATKGLDTENIDDARILNAISMHDRFMAVLNKCEQAVSNTGGRIGRPSDIVVSFACVDWSLEAVEFLTRQRMSSPQWLIEDIVKAGCHLVKVHCVLW